MNLDQRLSVPAHVMAREVGEEVVILDLDSGTYFGLDAVGAHVWQLLAGGNTLRQVCDEMLTTYEVPAADLERDVIALVESLAAKGLVRVG